MSDMDKQAEVTAADEGDRTEKVRRTRPHPVQMRMIAAHLEGCAELEKLCFHEPWSAKSLELLCNDGIGVGYLTTSGDGAGVTDAIVTDAIVTAYGGMLITVDEGQITNIAVHPDYRRQGLGDAVVKALLRHAKSARLSSVSLEVRASNAAAIALYKNNGFREVGRRKGFYTKPSEDALIMEARFK